MNDNDLIQIFFPIIKAGLIADGYDSVIVKQANQPTQQGVSLQPTVYFFKISDTRYGFPHFYDQWNSITGVMDHVEEQWYETRFQISALAIQDPKDISAPTASDIVNEVSMILQSTNTISQLMNNDIGILRISDVTNPYFQDDRDQFEAMPYFDFVLTHKRVRVSQSPILSSENYGVYRV